MEEHEQNGTKEAEENKCESLNVCVCADQIQNTMETHAETAVHRHRS